VVPIFLDQLQVLLHADIAIGLETFGPLIIVICWRQCRLKDEALLSCEFRAGPILACWVNGWHMRDISWRGGHIKGTINAPWGYGEGGGSQMVMGDR
jgi:hypothetical protein